jgi:hypothetical protein
VTVSGRARRGVVAAVVVALGVVPARATEPAMEVRLQPQRIGLEDLARLTVTVYGGEERVEAPHIESLDNLKLVSGPSTEKHFSWVNGVATSSLTFAYLVQGEDVGAAGVGPISVSVAGVTLRSEPVTAEVVPGSLAPPQRTRRRPLDPFGWDPFAELGPRRPRQQAHVELQHVVAEDRVVLGQPVTALVVLDTTVTGIEGFRWNTAPSYPGWWAQRVDLPEQITPEVIERDGKRYHRYTVARHVLVPLKTGQLTVPGVAARIGIRARSVFAPLQEVQRTAPEVVVQIDDRPAPPEGFAGAVGDLRYRATIEPEALDFGESAVLSVELQGSGNLPLVEAPPVWPSCAGCDTYPPEEQNRVTVDAQGIRGKRTWKVTVVPREAGELELAPVTLAVFDPDAGRYREQTLGPLTLAVAPPPVTPTPVAVVADAGVGAEGEAVVSQVPGAGGGGAAVTGVPVLWLLGALAAGVLGGGSLTWLMVRRRAGAVPQRRPGQSPAERARELQALLESWWLRARDRSGADALKRELEAVRQELEAVRFAPGRADHSETITVLEGRVRRLLRRA